MELAAVITENVLGHISRMSDLNCEKQFIIAVILKSDDGDFENDELHLRRIQYTDVGKVG